MKTPETSRMLLEKALKEMPYGSSLSAARFHINRALNEIAKVESHKAAVGNAKSKQKTPWEQWKMDLDTGTLNNTNLHPIVLKNLENLIAQEQAKIDSIKKIDNVKSSIGSVLFNG